MNVSTPTLQAGRAFLEPDTDCIGTMPNAEGLSDGDDDGIYDPATLVGASLPFPASCNTSAGAADTDSDDDLAYGEEPAPIAAGRDAEPRQGTFAHRTLRHHAAAAPTAAPAAAPTRPQRKTTPITATLVDSVDQWRRIDMGRAAAKGFLADKKVGTFLVRKSSMEKTKKKTSKHRRIFALTIKMHGDYGIEPANLLIGEDYTAKVFRLINADGETITKGFKAKETLEELISSFVKNENGNFKSQFAQLVLPP